MHKYRKLLGMIIDGMFISDLEKYYDLSTEREEWAYIVEFKNGTGMGINCDLFMRKYA